MFRAFLACSLASGLLAAGTAPAADDAYTLKLYQSKKGDRIEYERGVSTTLNVLFSSGGVEKKNQTASGSKEAYTEEILEKKAGDKSATKLSRAYAVAEKSEKGKTVKAAYAGETVLIEKKGDKYELSVKGKALEEAAAPELFRNLNKGKDEPQNEDFLPDGPVKVGGTWTIPADKSEKMFKTLGGEGLTVDAKKSTIGGKLLKAYKKDGAQFGVLELTFTVVVTEVDLGGKAAKAAPDSRLVAKATIDTCIDGTVPFEDSKTEMTIDVSAELPNVGTITLTGTTTSTDKERAAKK